MKKIVIVTIAVLCSKFSFAQPTILPYKAGWGTLDYSVPESPASKILGNSPDNILKPSSVRNVALSVGNYFFTSGNSIPKNVAVEISPLLLNGKASLNDYNQNKFLYRLRLSLGTNVLNNGGYSVAEGVRMTLMDKTDLRSTKSNPGFTNFLYTTATNNAVAHNKAFACYAAKNASTVIAVSDQYFTDKTFRHLIDSVYANDFIDINAIAAYRDSIRNLLWNAPIWEVGFAASQSSPDSLVKNLKFSQIGFWSTLGLPIGKKGQLLAGTKLAVVDSIQWQTNFSIGERFYYGSNNIKGFLQAQYDYKNNTNYFTTSLGCQFNIANGIWGDFSFNLVVDGTGKLSYQPGFNIALATPEKKKP